LSNDPNVPTQQPEPQPGQFPPPYQGQGQPFPPQYPHPQPGQFPQQGPFQPPTPGQPFPPQYQQWQYPPQAPGPQPQQVRRERDPNQPKSRFGVSFWIVAAILAVIVLGNAAAGHGEAILIVLGIAAALTGLYSLIFKKRSWVGLPGRNAAMAVAIAGGAAILIGGIAASASPAPVTSATLEADAAAKLKTREDQLAKSEADSTAQLAARETAVKKAEDAVKARETAVGGAEVAAAANTIKEGTWTVGKDIAPGTYRTSKELISSCYWAITATGSNGRDIIENDNVKGGFPQVVLAEGQTFESDRCGTWTKQ
jgi:hypothetical protein